MRRIVSSLGSRTRTSFRWLMVLVGFAFVGLGATAALALWTTVGTGTGTGSVGTLAPPTGVSAAATYSTVNVSWTAPTPPAGVLAGYLVSRTSGATTVNACGTNPATQTYVAAGATTCADTAVPDGTYTYRVTAVWRSWTSASAPSAAVTVAGDLVNPTQTLALNSATNAVLSGSTIYFRNNTAGSFRIASSVFDSGSGPASATFPAVSATGWTHAAETVNVGTGTNPKVYTSSPFSWTTGAATPSSIAVVGRDLAGNSVTTTLGVTLDNTGPTGGALTVNSVAATAAGSTSAARTSFTIARTDYTADAGSGFVSSTLTRETAPYTGNACGTYAAPITLTGAPAQTGLATGCYRYTLTGTDALGNTSSLSTVVRYDVTAPTQAVTLSSPGGGYLTGTTVYVRTNAAGSFTLTSAVTDNESGPASVTFPLVNATGWTHPAQTVTTGTGSPPTVSYTSSTYSWTNGAAQPATTTLTAADVIGNTRTLGLNFTLDNTAPAGGALTVNGTAATAGGSTSTNTSGGYAIARTDFTDAGSGMASSTLTVEQAPLSNNVCGAYGSPTVIPGSPAQSGLASACYRYRLTGIDNVGFSVSLSTVVRVDATPPTGGALTVNGTAATAGGSGSYATGNFPINVRTDFTDPNSGMASNTLQRSNATLTGNTCGTFGAATTIMGNPNQTGLTTGCYRYVLTGIDNFGNVSTLTTIVKLDTGVPTGGALTVNGVAATAGGSNSTSNATSFAIARTDYTDANSGMASSTLTREFATLTGTTCGTYGAATTITGSPTQTGLGAGCYRYRLTGIDNAGNSASLTTVVQQRVVVTAVSLLNGPGTVGRIDAGDQIEITFSDALAVNSICSTWTGNNSNQTLGGNNNVNVRLNNSLFGDDTLTFSADSCTLNIGTINLNYAFYSLFQSIDYGGTGVGASTVEWDVATRTLTITLGTASANGLTVTSSDPTLTPSGSLVDPNNVGVGNTFTLPAAQYF